MSKGLTVIAFVFLLPFILLGGMWMIARRRPIITSPGSAQGTSTTRPGAQGNSAQGNAPGSTGSATDILNASANVLKTAAPIIKGIFDGLVQSNDDYEPDPSEPATAPDSPIGAPFLDAYNPF